jgi:hypothetical protein
MKYDFDFYPECVKGILTIKERGKVLKQFLAEQDEGYILALYDKLYSRKCSLRIESEYCRMYKSQFDAQARTIKILVEKLKENGL